MQTHFAGRREWPRALCLAVILSGTFALGFIPTSREIGETLVRLWSAGASGPLREILVRSAFPLLAVFFSLSLPRRGKIAAGHLVDWRELAEISVVPVLIAALFGAGHRGRAMALTVSVDQIPELIWLTLLIPIGEECLFRGWLYQILQRLWPMWGSATNPVPLSLWLTSVAFSLWHLQNLRQDPVGLVIFQLVSTFFSGLWLGYLRWKSGRVWPCILGHVAINTATALF